MRNLAKIILILISFNSLAQENLNLKDCYNLVTKNYPLAKQSQLYEKQNLLDIEVIKTEKLPQFDFSAQATYQSDITQMPVKIPNISIEPPNKDQYKATISVNQLIYDGGMVNASTHVKSDELKTQQKQVEVTLYQLKKRVNQLYFSILLIQEKKNLLTAKKNQLSSKLEEVKAGIKYGALLPASDKVLEAELLKIAQQFFELDLNKTNLIETLSNLIGEPISKSATLETPTILTNLTTEIKRPELELFQLQKDYLETSEKLISKQNNPKLLGFATGGYGNPGLNMLDNSFQTYYHLGIKLNWNVFDWNANKKQRESLLINKDIIDTETAAFKLNTTIELTQQETDILRISELIESDKSIIELRKEILKSAESQLKNGVITSSAYITELTNLYEDENNLSTHKIELLLAKSNYNLTQGIP